MSLGDASGFPEADTDVLETRHLKLKKAKKRSKEQKRLPVTIDPERIQLDREMSIPEDDLEIEVVNSNVDSSEASEDSTESMLKRAAAGFWSGPPGEIRRNRAGVWVGSNGCARPLAVTIDPERLVKSAKKVRSSSK